MVAFAKSDGDATREYLLRMGVGAWLAPGWRLVDALELYGNSRFTGVKDSRRNVVAGGAITTSEYRVMRKKSNGQPAPSDHGSDIRRIPSRHGELRDWWEFAQRF